ncbi:integrase catalytic domain-containing protein [Trichonephila clavipes]|nr:integrase catalytic domain-containing protein [Trichonephila clavipes]
MSKEALKALNRKRGAVKVQLTRIKNFMNNPDEKDKTHLESKLDTLKSLRIKLSDIRDEYYEAVADDSDLEPLKSEILDLEDDCEDIQRNVDSQRSPGSETLPNMEPRITTSTLNVNSECFQPKQTVESFENEGEFVGYSKGHSTMLLSTAVVNCQNSRGEVFPLRALLDSGSQSNLITHEVALALELKSERVNTSICDVNGTPQFIKKQSVYCCFKDETGRFIVKMPLLKDPSCLGDSKQMALRRLNSLWRRLVQDPKILELYRNFIHEYLEMGHMEEVVEDEDSAIVYYLPHHGVYRQESKTTPLRVVFNASSITTSGESLNSLQLNGGVTQRDLFSILLNFRACKFATKTLGLLWKPHPDSFAFNISPMTSNCDNLIVTKKSVISTIARIFDPLGLIGPVITRAKILLQSLGQLKLDWNDPLPSNLVSYWKSFIDALESINCLDIPRYCLQDKSIRTELHGFSDSSEKAHGAALYLRCINTSEEISVGLLCSKSKVVPLKSITIPRLELCGAVLLSKLLKRTLDAFKVNISQIYLWTDSSIVLAWIKKPLAQLKIFVRNRVSIIQELTESDFWKHVNSENNPADILSRGAEAALTNIRNSFWIPSARNVVRKILRTCITCRKVSAKGSQQLMADLPAARVTACRVFSQAIHLEIVSDLTTEAFLAALKRFVARRG